MSELSHIEQVTSWRRVLNAARRTAGKKYLDRVHTQREDRRNLGVPRDQLPQGEPNDMDMTCNAQAFINISRKRLCGCASPDTREAWKQVIAGLEKIDPILAEKCVPECIYRGFCPEFDRCCEYVNTKEYQERLKKYRSYESN